MNLKFTVGFGLMSKADKTVILIISQQNDIFLTLEILNYMVGIKLLTIIIIVTVVSTKLV